MEPIVAELQALAEKAQRNEHELLLLKSLLTAARRHVAEHPSPGLEGAIALYDATFGPRLEETPQGGTQ